MKTLKKTLGSVDASAVKAGYIGEILSSTVASASAVSLTTNTAANVTSLTLTPGDWDITAVADFQFAASTSYTALQAGLSTTSQTLGSQDTFKTIATAANVPTAAFDPNLVVPIMRLSVAANTTVYLVAKAVFTVSTLKAYGSIRALRVR